MHRHAGPGSGRGGGLQSTMTLTTRTSCAPSGTIKHRHLAPRQGGPAEARIASSTGLERIAWGAARRSLRPTQILTKSELTSASTGSRASSVVVTERPLGRRALRCVPRSAIGTNEVKEATRRRSQVHFPAARKIATGAVIKRKALACELPDMTGRRHCATAGCH